MNVNFKCKNNVHILEINVFKIQNNLFFAYSEINVSDPVVFEIELKFL